MSIEKIIETTEKVFKDALQAQEESVLSRDLTYAMKDILKRNQEIQERHEKLQLPEAVTKEMLSAVNNEYKAMEDKLNSLTMTDKNNIIKSGAETYLESVRNFTKQGGKGFYDIGTIATIKYDQDVEKFKKELEKLKEMGLDLLILKEEKVGNPEQSMHGTAYRMSIMMPSSQYDLYEKHMVENHKEHMFRLHNDISRENYLIPPFISERDIIPKLLEEVKNKDEDVDRYNFAIFGYSTIKLDTNSGYGKFNEYRPDQKALLESAECALQCADYFNKKSDHINGIMPTNIIYDKKEVEQLGIENESTQRKTIVRDLQLKEMQPELKQVKKRKIKKAP